MNLLLINVVLLGHWLSDFVLQQNKRKEKGKQIIKNKNVKKLIPHSIQYSLIITFLLYILQIFNIIISIYFLSILIFFSITLITHFLTDFIITKINETHLRKNKRHKYMVTIGFDQYIHYALLFWTIKLFFIIKI